MILFAYGFRPCFLFAGPFGGLDSSGNPAMLGANLFHEMLCVQPGAHYRD